MATLVSSATLLPLTGIDALELLLDDLAHVAGVIQRDAAGEVGKRRGGFLADRHREGDLPVFGNPFRTLERPEHGAVFRVTVTAFDADAPSLHRYGWP